MEQIRQNFEQARQLLDRYLSDNENLERIAGMP